MKKLLYLLLFLFLNTSILAQSYFSSLILSSSDSTRLIISKGREKLLTNIQKHEGEKNMEYLKYLQSQIDSNKNILLFIDEEQLISFLTGDKDFFLTSLEEKDWILDREVPEFDNLFDSCHAVLERNIEYWKSYINELELNEEEEIIYTLFMSQMGFGLEKPKALSLSKKYQRKYKDASYVPYAKSLKSDFTTGSMGYAIGFGDISLHGPASRYIDASGVMTFDMDYFVNKFYFSTSLNINLKGSSLFEMGGYDEYDDYYIYEKGNRATHFSIGAKLGSLVYKNKFLKLYPYGSISLSNLSVSHTIYDIEDLSIATGLGMGAGLGLDVTLFNWKGSDLETGYVVNHHLGLRFCTGGESVLAFRNFSNYSYLFMSAGIVWWMGD